MASSVVVGDRFDEPVAQCVGRDAERADVILQGDAFGDLRVRGARLDQRSPQRLEELTVLHVPGAVCRHLAHAARDDILVSLAAGLGVVGGSETIANRFNLFENEAVVVKRAERDDGVFVDLL